MQQIVFFQIAAGLLNLTTTILPALRVYAIWGQSWICFIAVMSLGLVNVTTNIMYSPGLVTSAYSLAPEVPGCWYTPLPLLVPIQSSLETAGFACIIAQELLVLILTWIRTYKLRSFVAEEEVPNRLSSLLLRDGTIYFSIQHFGTYLRAPSLMLYIFGSVILALNMAGMVTSEDRNVPRSTAAGLEQLQNTVQTMLLSRFMLALREAYQSDHSGGASHAVGSRHWSSGVRFALDAWLAASDEYWEPPPPVVCDDPFAVDVLRKNREPQDASASSDLEPAADEPTGVESSAV